MQIILGHIIRVFYKIIRSNFSMKFYTIPTFILIGGFIQNVYSEEVKKIEELTLSASPIGLQSLEL